MTVLFPMMFAGGNLLRNLFITRTIFLTIVIWLWGLSLALASGNVKYTPERQAFLKIETLVDLTIMGAPIATKEQCVNYLLRHNHFTLINTTPKQLVDYYYAEAGLEGIRPDLAFAQALHETGNFRYGGDVISLQNNYCGLGTTGKGVSVSPRCFTRSYAKLLLESKTNVPLVGLNCE